MVCRIAFLHRPNEPAWSGKRRSTEALVTGLRQIGIKAAYTSNSNIKADYYAVDCIDDLSLLPSVDKSRQIAWIRRDVTQSLSPQFDFDPPGHLFASSQFVAQAWRDYPVIVLPDAAISPRWVPVVGGRWRLLYVGRVCRAKGLPLLLKAMAFLPYNWHLDIVGRIYDDFKPLIRSLRLQASVLASKERYEALAGVGCPRNQAGPKASVTFHGEQPYWRVQRFLAGATAVVVPAQREPFGRAIIEALAHGKPAIAIKGSGGPDEVLPIRFLSDHNPLRLADTIRHAYFSEDLKAIAARYQPKVVAQQFMDHLETNRLGTLRETSGGTYANHSSYPA